MNARMGDPVQGSASLPSFPLRVGPTSRYLVDQDGRPTLLQGDAAWTLIAGTIEADAPRYLDHLVANGFNAAIVNLVEAYFAPDPPRNLRGDEPFVQAGRFDTPNEAYMDYAHWVLQEAERRGIVVFLVPTYLGYPVPHASHGTDYGYGRVEGWRNEVVSAGVAGCRDFGRYLGHRFGDLSNVIWTMGGDDNPGDVLEHLDAMARGIRETAPGGLMAAHVLPESGPFDQYPGADWLSIDFTYSYSIVHKAVLQHYLAHPAPPKSPHRVDLRARRQQRAGPADPAAVLLGTPVRSGGPVHRLLRRLELRPGVAEPARHAREAATGARREPVLQVPLVGPRARSEPGVCLHGRRRRPRVAR